MKCLGKVENHLLEKGIMVMQEKGRHFTISFPILPHTDQRRNAKMWTGLKLNHIGLFTTWSQDWCYDLAKVFQATFFIKRRMASGLKVNVQLQTLISTFPKLQIAEKKLYRLWGLATLWSKVMRKDSFLLVDAVGKTNLLLSLWFWWWVLQVLGWSCHALRMKP